MANVQLSNVSGGNAHVLNSSTQLVANIPSGFTVHLALDGHYNVLLASSPPPSTGTNDIVCPPLIGICYVKAVSEPTGLPMQIVPPVYVDPEGIRKGNWWVSGQPLVVKTGLDGEVEQVIGTVPNVSAANLLINVQPGLPITAVWTPITYDYTYVATGSVSGSSSSGTALGGFDADIGLKSVTFHPTSISSETYVTEFQAVSTGLVLGLTVLLFAFILRLVRAIPSQGGDF